jgi:ribosomal protein S12 methylthiotransferase
MLATKTLAEEILDLKQERRARLMRLQEEISARRLARHVGRTMQVLVDSVEAGGAIARSPADAPEIDGVVHVARSGALKPGEFATVRVTRTDVHDMWAEPA